MIKNAKENQVIINPFTGEPIRFKYIAKDLKTGKFVPMKKVKSNAN